MYIFRWTFMLLTLCGCLPPASWTSPFKKFLYNIYTIFLVFLVHSLVLTQILDIVFNCENQDDFSDNFYLTVGVFVSCCKMCNLLTSHKNYAILIETLQEEPLTPVNNDEVEIQTRFEKWAQRNAIVYIVVIECCLGCMVATSVSSDFKTRQLTYRAWIPYNYTSLPAFSITYAHQMLSMTICTFLNITCDNLFSSFMIHTYCVFEILEYRLKNIVKHGNESAKQCARLHNHIYKFATMVNEEFKTIVFFQFLVSMAMCCFDLYRLDQNGTESKFMEMMVYAVCTLMQILYYCWYGNEVKLKSLEIPDVILECNWPALDNDAKKILLMMMKRATVPIEFSSVHVISMNLESFKTIVKTSYSVFNVLRQRREN
ncbi:odorant receptor 46a-like [Hylaeus anthracinus]|uniref:odorant receptor 46a-like n=1 Tax=Hylaeus anthracinus TaxID=313031 RepID=UPI0023B9E963|nr:odorant receptor 46a-like [Hylaeus anthracinus]